MLDEFSSSSKCLAQRNLRPLSSVSVALRSREPVQARTAPSRSTLRAPALAPALAALSPNSSARLSHSFFCGREVEGGMRLKEGSVVVIVAAIASAVALTLVPLPPLVRSAAPSERRYQKWSRCRSERARGRRASSRSRSRLAWCRALRGGVGEAGREGEGGWGRNGEEEGRFGV